jgi:hypothetical protein
MKTHPGHIATLPHGIIGIRKHPRPPSSPASASAAHRVIIACEFLDSTIVVFTEQSSMEAIKTTEDK